MWGFWPCNRSRSIDGQIGFTFYYRQRKAYFWGSRDMSITPLSHDGGARDEDDIIDLVGRRAFQLLEYLLRLRLGSQRHDCG